MKFSLTFTELEEIVHILKKCCCSSVLEFTETSIVGTIDEFRALAYTGYGQFRWRYTDGLRRGEADDPISAVIECYKGVDE